MFKASPVPDRPSQCRSLRRSPVSSQSSGLNLSLALLEHERRTHDAFPDVLDIVDDRLKVRCRVVRLCDVDVVGLAGGRGRIEIRDRDEPAAISERSDTQVSVRVVVSASRHGESDILLGHASQQLQPRQDLALGHARLDDCRHHGDPDVLGGDIVRGRDGGDVDVCG